MHLFPIDLFLHNQKWLKKSEERDRMKKAAPKKIKNSTLVFFFILLVIVAIIISVIIKTIILIAHSSVDNRHQFILAVKQHQEEWIIAFTPASNSIAQLHMQGEKPVASVHQWHIPIDGQFILADSINPKSISSLLFTMIFQCSSLTCTGVNRIDALKLLLFSNHIRPSAIKTGTIADSSSLFTDDTVYHEALSIAIVNASGQAGLGNSLATFLTNIGGNVISVTAGEDQDTTTMQSTYGKESYTIQRFQKLLHLPIQNLQSPGISDIIITIGKKHSEF